jgi:cysteinyl-tRNA synthetase
MNDDFNSPVLIARLFDAVRLINSVNDGKASLRQEDIDLLKQLYSSFVFDVLGLQPDQLTQHGNGALEHLMEYLLEIRSRAKTERNFRLSDEIRDRLLSAGVQINDTKEGSTWKLK